MVRSAARSLQTTFDSVDQILAGGDSGAALARVAHNLKGQLLNMGETGWADIARMVEFAAKAEEVHDYAPPLQAIREAMSAIMEYRSS
jgi:HPt (histidine-containing phosphotransfer) domain-containing protein